MENIFKLSKDEKTLIGVLDKNITHIAIPNGITTIECCAFSGCSALESIDIPNSVTTIGNAAFKECSSLQSIDIPNSITTIGDEAFSECSALQSIDIPNSVTTIGKFAFLGCEELQSIYIPNSVTTIGISAFSACSSLQSIDVSEDNQNYTSINGILYNKGLKTIIKFPEKNNATEYKIPNSVTTIEERAFYNCSSLQSIDIPNSVTTIGNAAFRSCKALQSIAIPNSVTTIGKFAFIECWALQSIDVSEDNKNYTSIDGILYDKGLKMIIQFPIKNNATEYKIPNSVTTIGVGAFFCKPLLQSIDIPNSVTTIEAGAFGSCMALQSIDIPNSVTTIGNSAFYNCPSLQSIHIHITDVENANIGKCAFNITTTNNCVLYVPPGTRWAYRHHPVFGKFKHIEIEKQE